MRARLCKILQCRLRTTTVPTCPEYQLMLEKAWPPLSQAETDNHTAIKSLLACTATRKEACALESLHLFFSNTYTNRSPPSWLRGRFPGVRVAAARVIRYSTAAWCIARQCIATSVGNQPLETIIDVARNVSTLHAVFAPREIRARLCKILQCRLRTTTVATCSGCHLKLDK